MKEIKELIKQTIKSDNTFNQIQFEKQFGISMEELSKVREKPKLILLEGGK